MRQPSLPIQLTGWTHFLTETTAEAKRQGERPSVAAVGARKAGRPGTHRLAEQPAQQQHEGQKNDHNQPELGKKLVDRLNQSLKKHHWPFRFGTGWCRRNKTVWQPKNSGCAPSARWCASDLPGGSPWKLGHRRGVHARQADPSAARRRTPRPDGCRFPILLNTQQLFL